MTDSGYIETNVDTEDSISESTDTPHCDNDECLERENYIKVLRLY